MADAATYPKPSKHVGRTCIPSAGFEPAIPAIKQDRLKYISLQIISFVILDVAAVVLHIQVFSYADCAERNTHKRQHYHSLCFNHVVLSEASSPATMERPRRHIMNGYSVKLDILYTSASKR